MTTPTLPDQVADFTAFLPFTKVAEDADGTIRVHTVVNDESVDDQGEVLDYAGTKTALDEFMKWANVREMHQPSAVGTVESLTHDDLAKVSEAILHVVDPVAIAKVHAGVYKGTSVGGRKGPATLQKIGGQTVRRLTQPHIIELSLVDRPSRPTAVLTLLKRADGEEAPVADQSPTPDPAAPVEPGTPAADDTLAKAAEPAEPDSSPAAPVAGESADEAPADGQPEPDPDPLAKSAADDVVDAHMVIERITRLIEQEAGEGEAGQVGDLRAALEAMQRFTAAETAEVGTPEDVAAVEAEKPVEVIVVNDMYYAAVTGDLAKRALQLRKAAGEPAEHPDLDQLVTLAIAAGGRCGHELEKAALTDAGQAPALDSDTLAKVATAAIEQASDALMTKVSSAIGSIARPDDLAAVKAEILGALGPMQEELAKIASQPTSGGPVRYAQELRRFADGGSALTPALEAEVLAKAAAATTDPAVREALGHQAATAQIRAQQGA